MQLFTNEYGDAIRWRVALACAAGVAASVGLAVALFGRTPEATRPPQTAQDAVYAVEPDPGEPTLQEGTQESIQESPQEETQVPTEAPEAPEIAAVPAGPTDAPAAPAEAAGVPQDATDAWLAATAGTELLGGLTRESVAALAAAVSAWQQASLGAEGVALTVLEAPEVTPAATYVRLRAEAPGHVTWAEASIAPGGAWEVREAPEGLRADPTSPIKVSDTGRLSEVCGETVASEVSRILTASGIEGIEGAWTCERDVTRDGDVVRLTVVVPTSDGQTSSYLVGYDAVTGLLEIGEGAGAGGGQ